MRLVSLAEDLKLGGSGAPGPSKHLSRQLRAGVQYKSTDEPWEGRPRLPPLLLVGRGAFPLAAPRRGETWRGAGWAAWSWQQTAPGREAITAEGKCGEDGDILGDCGGWRLEGMGQSKPRDFLRKQRPDL